MLFGSLPYGSNIFAVLLPSEPSMKPFTPPMRTKSLPKSAIDAEQARASFSAIGQRRSTRQVSLPVLGEPLERRKSMRRVSGALPSMS